MDLEQKAIERVKAASEMSLRLYHQPLLVTDSGGKDSAVTREIVRRTGVPFEVMHNLTTADAPETIYYVKDRFKELENQGIRCGISYPQFRQQRITMWSLIPMKKYPPTRIRRYCCEVLKESSGKNRFITTGVRWAESYKRRQNRGVYENFTHDPQKKIIMNNDNDEKRSLFESCAVKGKRICNPIIDWTDSDVWDYLRSEKIPVNPLYDMGFHRVGCLGCPMAGRTRWVEFSLFPKYQRAYIRAFDRMLQVIRSDGKKTKWKTGEDVFLWWMESEQTEGQIALSDLPEWNEENQIIVN